jgi:hypothetical protein
MSIDEPREESARQGGHTQQTLQERAWGLWSKKRSDRRQLPSHWANMDKEEWRNVHCQPKGILNKFAPFLEKWAICDMGGAT